MGKLRGEGDDLVVPLGARHREATEAARLEQPLDTVEEVEAGKVISQDPASGQLQAGSEIHLVVSSGAEQVAVPDVRARTTADARSTLEAAGFTVEQKYVDESASTHLDRVQRTDPVRGTRLAKGSTVTIYVI